MRRAAGRKSVGSSFLILVCFFVYPATARPLGSFFPWKEASHASASAVEHATLGTLGTLRAALSLGKCSSKMVR